MKKQNKVDVQENVKQQLIALIKDKSMSFEDRQAVLIDLVKKIKPTMSIVINTASQIESFDLQYKELVNWKKRVKKHYLDDTDKLKMIDDRFLKGLKEITRWLYETKSKD